MNFYQVGGFIGEQHVEEFDIPQQQEQITEPTAPPKNITIEPSGGSGLSIGPITINYGDIRMDLIAAVGVLLLITIGYIVKKKIDKKYRGIKK